MRILVYRVKDGVHGAGLVFVREDGKEREFYERDDCYEYVGTLEEFMEKVKKALEKEEVYDESYIE